jgi:LysM repeat protein
LRRFGLDGGGTNRPAMFPRALALIAGLVLAAPAVATAAFPHVVEPGESLSSVAASDGLSVEALAAANGLSPQASLLAGTTLMIPAQTAAAEEPAAGDAPAQTGAGAVPVAPQAGSYVVQPGDTLSDIAARAGTSVEALAALNGIDPSAPLLAGTTLTLSSGGAEQQRSSPEAASEPPYPTEETVSVSEVGSIAEEQGVPASFAEAIAAQESGFNNGLTSSADARGVMQILPETWSFISQNLAGPSPLDPSSATSNVRGGVLLLRWLLEETGGDPAQAAAGYYQGLESVRQEGESPETEAYVNSVLALQGQFAGA